MKITPPENWWETSPAWSWEQYVFLGLAMLTPIVLVVFVFLARAERGAAGHCPPGYSLMESRDWHYFCGLVPEP
jgi:hypothetical protein